MFVQTFLIFFGHKIFIINFINDIIKVEVFHMARIGEDFPQTREARKRILKKLEKKVIRLELLKSQAMAE